jgi:putative ABC transport system permease protein
MKYRHRHRFEAINPAATAVVDEIEFSLRPHPWWGLVGLGMALSLPLLFAYRGGGGRVSYLTLHQHPIRIGRITMYAKAEQYAKIGQKVSRSVALGLRFNGPKMPLFLHLAFKEIWRTRGRFLLVSMVIALITTLVLFIAGLAVGLGNGNKEYLEKLNGELILYQQNVDLSIPSSRFNRSILNNVLRVEGVKDAGAIAFSNASIVFENGQEPLKVSLIGVEPGKPGEPPAYQGQGLRGKQEKGAIIGENVVRRTNLQVGDTFTLKATQGTEEKIYPIQVVGITDGRQYSIQPSVILPYVTWDQVRPKGSLNGAETFTFNIIGVKLENSADIETIAAKLEEQVGKVEAADRKTAYENTPGYGPQQSTLNTQRFFSLLIGVLVLGGFFQIQTLQKVAQIGMLKAIGTSNLVIALSFLLQIVLVTVLGVAMGAIGTLLLSLSFPAAVPIVFTQEAVLTGVVSIMLIGPLGGLVSLRILLKVEPLTALGLAS